MGAAAITTSGFPIDRARVAELLGFAAPLLQLLRLHRLGRLRHRPLFGDEAAVPASRAAWCRTWPFWSAFEVGQLYVPNSLVQISSIMPQKRNPVPIEHLRHLATVTAGRCDMMVNTMHNTPFTDMNDSEGEVQQAGYAAFESGGRVLELLAALLPACSIDGARVRRNCRRGLRHDHRACRHAGARRGAVLPRRRTRSPPRPPRAVIADGRAAGRRATPPSPRAFAGADRARAGVSTRRLSPTPSRPRPSSPAATAPAARRPPRSTRRSTSYARHAARHLRDAAPRRADAHAAGRSRARRRPSPTLKET